MKQSSFDTNDVKKCCERKLEIDFRDGKEFNGWFRLDDRSQGGSNVLALELGICGEYFRFIHACCRLSTIKETQILVPFMQGLPKQTFGSTEILPSNSFLPIFSSPTIAMVR